MKQLAGLTAIIAGLLLIIFPRYILRACEYEGFSRMHCSDTAQAEFVAGGLFILAGAAVLLMKANWAALTGASVTVGLSVAAYLIPDSFGFCHSSKMPCNYGMVPAVRLIAVVSGLLAAFAFVSLLLQRRKKGQT